MKRRVIAIGETVLDVLFREGKVVNSTPGGSMLNAAVSLGRTGQQVILITRIGNDTPGQFIRNFLDHNNVTVVQSTEGDPGKTTLALASLNDSGDADYTFYKDERPDRNTKFGIEPGAEDIILFGSFDALSDERRDELVRFLNKASAAGSFIIYDPNFRKPHLRDLERLMPRIIENLSFADVVRGSDEDFLAIFDSPDASDAAERVRNAGCSRLICTKNKDGVELITSGIHLSMEVPAITTVSTIGAGDSFNAGIIYVLLKMEISGKDLDSMERESWEKVLRMGTRFASDVCKGWDNFISQDLVKELKSC